MPKKTSNNNFLDAAATKKAGDTIHHVVKAYEDVIRAVPDSPIADRARAALLKIAEDWKKKGKTRAAARLYKKLMISR
ncbi:MAG: hypothetical protein AAB731_05120 [Patescibacteria group bacterium]